MRIETLAQQAEQGRREAHAQYVELLWFEGEIPAEQGTALAELMTVLQLSAADVKRDAEIVASMRRAHKNEHANHQRRVDDRAEFLRVQKEFFDFIPVYQAKKAAIDEEYKRLRLSMESLQSRSCGGGVTSELDPLVQKHRRLMPSVWPFKAGTPR
jgi:hypothetical protein